MSERRNKRTLSEANITESSPSKKRKIDTSTSTNYNHNNNNIQQQNQAISIQETTHHYNVNPTLNVQNDSESDLSDTDAFNDSDYENNVFNHREKKPHQKQINNKFNYNYHQNAQIPPSTLNSTFTHKPNEDVSQYNNPTHQDSVIQSTQRHYQRQRLRHQSPQTWSTSDTNHNLSDTQYSEPIIHQHTIPTSSNHTDDPFLNYYGSILLCIHSLCWRMWSMNWSTRWSSIRWHPALDYRIIIWGVIYVYIMTWLNCYKAIDYDLHPGPQSYHSFRILLLTTIIAPISFFSSLYWLNIVMISYCIFQLFDVFYQKHGLGHTAIYGFLSGIPLFIFFNVFVGGVLDFCGNNLYCYFQANSWYQEGSWYRNNPNNDYLQYIDLFFTFYLFLPTNLKLQALKLYIMRFELIYWFPFIYRGYGGWNTKKIIRNIASNDEPFWILLFALFMPFLSSVMVVVRYWCPEKVAHHGPNRQYAYKLQTVSAFKLWIEIFGLMTASQMRWDIFGAPYREWIQVIILISAQIYFICALIFKLYVVLKLLLSFCRIGFHPDHCISVILKVVTFIIVSGIVGLNYY